MSSSFVPVDLDQVLDEFEEQERKNGSPPKTKQNDSLDVAPDTKHPHVRFPSIDEPRTYSFNNPLDAILEEHSNNIGKAGGTSLAQELANYDFGPQLHDVHDDDEDDIHHNDDSAGHNVGIHIADSGNDSGTASEVSSTSEVIAEAEKITASNNFSLQQSKPSTSIDSSFSQPSNSSAGDSYEVGSSSMSSNPLNNCTNENDNESLEDEPDFISLLNSVVQEKSLCIQGLKSQTASFSSVEGSVSSITELTNEIKDMLVDAKEDLACAKNETIKSDNSILTERSGEREKELSPLKTDSIEINATEESKELINKKGVYSDDDETNIKLSEEMTCDVEGRLKDEAISSDKALNAQNDIPGVSLCGDSVLDDVDEAYSRVWERDSKDNGIALDSSSSTSRVKTDNETLDGNRFFNAMSSASAKCIESWEKEDIACEQESEEGIVQEFKPLQENDNGENLLLNLDEETPIVNPTLPTDMVVDAEGDLSQGVRPEIIQNYSNLILDSANQEQTSLTNPMGPIDSGSADSLCGTQDDNESQSTGSCTNDGGLPSESQLQPQLMAVHISSGDPEMGFVPPIWVPDDVATYCMTCGLKFSVIKRKHHCRACGKVLCSSCCNMKFPLPYMGNKDVRVCQVCCDILIRGNQQTMLMESLDTNTPAMIPDAEEPNGVPDLNADNESIDEFLPPRPAELEDLDDDELLNQALGGSVGEVEQVNQEATHSNLDSSSPVVSTLSLSDSDTLPINNGSSSTSLASAPLSPTLSDDSDISFRLDVEHVRALIPQESAALPPVLNLHNKAISIKEHPDPAEIMYRLKGKGETVIFLLNKNLIVKVKIVKLRCCVKKKCWCFVSDGMGAASQEEMVVLLECQHNENTVPKDVLSHFNTAFSYAKQGHVVSDLGFTIFGQPFLGSSSNAGFMYIKPSFQCLENLPLPTVPYVVGILIQRKEAPWAQLFPLRLMLRLGTEFRYYPCPLWSVRNRPTVYGEIGHTIMNLLTDFKNFQYSIPRITGLTIHMEDTKTTVRMPQDRFDEIIKVLNAAEEHMFAFGANFSSEADSHLVCIQEGETYKTQAINIQNKTRKVTGASFIVFTGSLKTSNPNDAKVSIIEDGLMIQMLPDAILELRKALREMQDYVIKTGSNATEGMVNQVTVEWASRDANKQTHLSPIDGRSLTDVPSIQVHSSCDFTKPDVYRIRWTNVFLERNGAISSRGLSSRGLSHLTAELARACCEALRPHLVGLFELDLKRLALRVNMDTDSVEYCIGAQEKPLPANLMADLDSALIPAINAAALKHCRGSLTVELFFSILSLFES